jgi:N-acetyl-1-D-myo-inositol-2-amino-2-deoxy-alpha-D-glucopyranoside deacetylase
MFVHAHPDDEVISTGGTMAAYAADPDTHVTLVTCTLGEMGEVLVPEFEYLRADLGDQLGGYRIGELERSCAALGVTDHRFLGGPGRWRDSGMMGTPANDDPRCFWQADLEVAAEALVRIVREVRPQVLVSYDDNGQYGHPDHIRAHQVTVRAFDAAADPSFAPEAGPPWQASKLYETAIARSTLAAGMEYFQRPDAWGENPFEGMSSVDDIPFAVDDEKITTEIEANGFFEAKIAAMRAHRTQMAVDGFFFAMADGIGHRAWGTEHYMIARGGLGSGTGGGAGAGGRSGAGGRAEAGGGAGAGGRPGGRETDLFAGLSAAGTGPAPWDGA